MGIQNQLWHIFQLSIPPINKDINKDTRNVTVSNTKKKSIIIKFIAFI